MKIRRTVIFIVVLIQLFLSFSVSSHADAGFPDAKDQSELAIEVRPFANKEIGISVLELPGYAEDRFYLFLPADADRGDLTLEFAYTALSVDGKQLKSGERTDLFAADGKYAVDADGKQYTLNVVSSEKLPSIHIETESGSLSGVHADKKHKEKGDMKIFDNKKETDAVLEYVKGRGNSSWRSNEKRSYSIKLARKTSLLGMKQAKRWALISNNMDPTLLRNAIAYSAAQLTALPYKLDFRFVDLYINGIYRGNYILSEKIEIGDGRLELTDLDKAAKAVNEGVKLSECKYETDEYKGGKICYYDIPNDPADISGDYLLEFEYPEEQPNGNSGFLTKSGGALILHSPEYASKAEVSYIAEKYLALEEALLSAKGRNRAGERYGELLDEASFADGLLLYEFAHNSDRGLTSFYIYYSAQTGKFHMAPIWDFDQSMGAADEALDCVKALSGEKESEITPFIYLLSSHPDFVEKMRDRFQELFPSFKNELAAETLKLRTLTEASARCDRLRWGYELNQKHDVELTDYPALRADHMLNALNELDLQAADLISATGRIIIPACVCAAALAAAVCIYFIIKSKRRKA